jgi:6-phospho-beta-glucosidase
VSLQQFWIFLTNLHRSIIEILEVNMSLIRLAVLGGSGVGTPELFNALLNWPGDSESRPEIHVRLLGRSPSKLERVLAISRRIVQEAYPPIHIEAVTHWSEGLEGADYVLNQVRVGGLDARAHDEIFPQKLGIAGEETIGPGGFANALRTIPVVLETLERVHKIAPDAVVLNLTNPAGIVQHAAMRYTNVHIISLCDSPITLGNEVARLLGLPRARITIDYLGMNHLGWIVGIREGEQSLMNLALARFDQLAESGVDIDYIRATRAIPIPYVRYYLYPERILKQQEGKIPRARQLQVLEQELLADYRHTVENHESDPSTKVARRGAVWYSTIVVPVLEALINDRGSTWVVNVANNQLVPWLSPETVIEAPAVIDRNGASSDGVAAHLLAEDLRTLLYSQAAYESLAVASIVERNRKRALQALVAHPLIRSVDLAESVLEAVWPTGGMVHDFY